MSKYEFTLKGDFTRLLNFIESQILKGSVSASLEDQSDYDLNGILCAVRVFERYSVIGSNRVSMNLTLLGNGEDLYISAITSGGSQAIFI